MSAIAFAAVCYIGVEGLKQADERGFVVRRHVQILIVRVDDAEFYVGCGEITTSFHPELTTTNLLNCRDINCFCFEK